MSGTGGWTRPTAALGIVAGVIALAIWWNGAADQPAGETGTGEPRVAIAEPDLTADEADAVARAMETGRVVFPSHIQMLRGDLNIDPVEMPAELSALAPREPVGTAVAITRPTFRWNRIPNVEAYSITVLDERLREVASSGPVKGTQWTPTRNLPRGQMLDWRVVAVGSTEAEVEEDSANRPHPKARFIVLTTEESDELAEQQERLLNEPVAMGLNLARLGLFADAEATFRQALNDPRFSAARVQDLLESLEQRGR